MAAILNSYGVRTKQWRDEHGPAMRSVDDTLVADYYYTIGYLIVFRDTRSQTYFPG
jgi:hypothetical protein